VIVIEHNLDVIKSADWLIDMGPEGGGGGGKVVVEGTPEEVATHPRSHTGRFLQPILEAGRAGVLAANTAARTRTSSHAAAPKKRADKAPAPVRRKAG
jgi:excinuclease ABC subunit A